MINTGDIMKKLFVILLLLIFTNELFAEEARILRYPNASETHVTFTHAGDVFVAPIAGGLARKLTSSEGVEMYPRFSPDGAMIAFSAEYDGNREIYTIPMTGGNPGRVTYSMDMPDIPARMGPDKVIMQWTPDGNNLLYRSRHKSWNAFTGRLYLVNKDGGLPDEIPLPRAGFASLSPDGKKLAYNRIFREYRTWKRYRGGMADEIWIYDFDTKEYSQITDNLAQDIIPMWYKDRIYYLSDRDTVMNIFSYNTNTKQTKKLTNFSEFDCKFASLGKGGIAFENGGYIYILDPDTDEVRKLEIQLADDFVWARSEWKNVKEDIQSFELSPEGDHAMFIARGDIYVVPKEHGITRNLTQTPGVHERNAKFSPDGKWIAFISDETGEDEIYVIKPDGSDKMQLTKNAESYRFELMWSPDSKKILCSDKTMRLYYIDISSKETKEIYKSRTWEIRDHTWSPDSKWIAFSDNTEEGNRILYLYSVENDKVSKISDKFFSSFGAEFDKDGKYLFFVSNRTFNPELGNFELSYVYNDMSKIYGYTLSDTLKSPFALDEKEDKDKKKKDGTSLDIKIDNIEDRIFEFPVPAANYSHLSSQEDGKLYYVSSRKGSGSNFYRFDLSEKKEDKIGDFSGFEVSADGKYVLFREQKDYYIEKLDAKVDPKNKLDLSGLEMKVDHRAEWKQIFNEAWRQMKYFFYDPNMHGLDWVAEGNKYRQLLPYVHHRSDLTYLIGELIGELNVGHAYVGGGDQPEVKKVNIGLLGADFELDKGSGFYKITNILEGRNWDEQTRSPLTMPGIEIEEGDYLLMIDGKKLTASVTPFVALENKSEQYVKLTVNDKPSLAGAKEFTVKTIAHENGLRYFNWVESNRAYVDSASNGKVGYVHIPNMMYQGLNEFVKYFYPQIRKEGLIVDDRFNGGGFVSQMILERLRRVLSMVGHARNQEITTTYPDAVFTGPMVCLVNQLSASDGDIFPYNFKRLGLGEVIGKRTWGGVVGIRGSLPFIDGSYLYKPEFSHFSVEGDWILEGVGMKPDLVVDNNPALEYRGIDQQLQKAIEVILKKIKEYQGPELPDVPEYPIKK